MPRALGISALLLAIVALFYWRIALTGQYEWMWSPDLAGQVLPWFQVQALEWHRHAFPMWDAYLWNGQPLFGQAQPGAAYPLNWLLFWLPLDAAGHIQPIALAWYFIAIHFMAAAFCYRLCRDLGRSVAASIAAGMIFSFAGYIGSTDWPQMINGAVWMPLVFLYLLRAAAGKRPIVNGALAGTFLGLAWLSGHHQVVMFTSLAFAGSVDLLHPAPRPHRFHHGARRGGFRALRRALRRAANSSRPSIRPSREAVGGRAGRHLLEGTRSLLRSRKIQSRAAAASLELSSPVRTRA